MPDANAQPKLTKTERALREGAARDPDGTLRAWLWSGMTSRPGPGGKRAVSALQGLVHKGLADGLHVLPPLPPAPLPRSGNENAPVPSGAHTLPDRPGRAGKVHRRTLRSPIPLAPRDR
jgi:hypothetical protein